MGSLRNFETCINRSRGKYIHLLHGDDRVKQGYYKSITDILEKYPQAGAAFCAWEHINTEGKFLHQSRLEAAEPCLLDDWLHKLAEHPRLQYVAITVKREIYEKLGSFYLVHYGEDWEMWARIAKDYYLTGQNVKDIEKVISVIIGYLPLKDQRRMHKTAKKNYTYWILNETSGAWYSHKNNKIAYNQIKAILGIYIDRHVVSRIVVLLLHIWTDPYRSLLKKHLD